MSRIRVGHGPSDWRIEEPRSAHTVSRGGRMAVGISAAERDRLAKIRATMPDDLTPRKRPSCGEPMPRFDGHCGRFEGHTGRHRSRATMDREARSRRAVVVA